MWLPLLLKKKDIEFDGRTSTFVTKVRKDCKCDIPRSLRENDD